MLPPFTASTALELSILSEELASVKISRMSPIERARLIRALNTQINELSEKLLAAGVDPRKYTA